MYWMNVGRVEGREVFSNVSVTSGCYAVGGWERTADSFILLGREVTFPIMTDRRSRSIKSVAALNYSMAPSPFPPQLTGNIRPFLWLHHCVIECQLLVPTANNRSYDCL